MREKAILFTRLIIIGLLIAGTSSCKKDDPIIKKEVVITWANPADITVGTPLSATQLNATADVSGTFVYTPVNGTVLSLGTNQNLKVDFTPTDAVHNNTATKTVTINVIAKKDPIITWANPADITVGTLLSATQLNATADVPGTFVYTPAIGASLAVGANQDLKVDFTPTDAVSYNTATKTVTINVVSKKDPIITWANPANITVGTLLSATQLNATADVAGTFVYTPPSGTALSEGVNQDLKADFTPTDLASYNVASKTVKINVMNTFTDPRDGNVYHTITIGTQVWMVENLRYLPSVVGPSTGSQTTPCYYVYGYNGTSVTDAKATTNYTTYGVLYNWPAAMAGSASSTANPSGIQGVCPTGWHLPSDAEWTQLTTYLGGESVAGVKLREAGTTHWVFNTRATNETGFTALPGGRRHSGEFDILGSYGIWWSTTEGYPGNAWRRFMSYDNSDVNRSYFIMDDGFSVRCVRD